MNAELLMAQCEQALKDRGEEAQITLVLPWQCNGEKARLGKTIGSYGYVMSEARGGGTNVAFSCRKVYDALKKSLEAEAE